jgi:hypothetical protein
MKTQTEMKLVEFLTSKENFPFAVEILRLGEEIRKPLLTQFWRDLKCRLENSPDRPSGVPASMQLRFSPDDRITDPSHTELDFLDVELMGKADQYLSYVVYQEQGKHYFQLGYGISWNLEMPSKSSKLYKMKPVVELRQKLEMMDFEEGGTCIGYHTLFDDGSIDDLLAAIAKDSEGLLREISEGFWLLVKETRTKVEKANKAIVGGP